MSGRHWIDELFRKRLERRTFPVEEGELEEMRALIRARNAAPGAVRGGVSKWWLSALLPVAGLLWWAYGGNAGSGGTLPPIVEARPVQGLAAAGPHLPGPAGTRVPAKAEPLFAALDTASRVHGASAADAGTRAIIQHEAVPQATGRAWPVPAVIPSRPVPDGRMEAQGVKNAHAGEAAATPQRLQRESGPDPGRVAAVGREDEARRSLPDVSPVDQAGNKEPAWPEATGTTAPPFALGGADAVRFMEPRWPTPPEADRPVPLRVGMPELKRLPMGELHFFGAQLSVHTRSGDGWRSGAQAGSLVGMEYRMRAKRFSWATGVYYGTYGLKAGQGADVVLNFVEVPLLAGYGIGYGRFGLLMQGGFSVDLLFNSSGRYALGDAGAGAGFPDDAFRRANCSWLLRPQATYQLGEHLTVGAGPLWKAQFGKVANAGALDAARIGASGISFGLSWRLDRSTF